LCILVGVSKRHCRSKLQFSKGDDVSTTRAEWREGRGEKIMKRDKVSRLMQGRSLVGAKDGHSLVSKFL
jgi:hypothetical protein